MPDVAFPSEAAGDIVRRALAEDMPWGDLTSRALVPAGTLASGRFVCREAGVTCGLPLAAMVFAQLDPEVRFAGCVEEGTAVAAGAVIAEVRGAARPILAGERTALNLMQRLGGIATATSQFIAAVAGTGARIVDTRKTAPGLRALDKYAVRCGGGSNHRFSLSDGALVKDNHLAAIAGRSVPDALRAMRSSLPHTARLEVEVDRLEQIEDALSGGADIILLDNMTPNEMRSAVDMIGARALCEASGGITLETVRSVAEAGVDLISVGALTHSVQALEIGLDLVVR